MQVPLRISILKQSIFAQTKNKDKCLEIETWVVIKFFEVKCIWLARNVVTSYIRPTLSTGKDQKKLKHKITILKEQMFISYI